jgi:hypothetical protein
MERQEMAKAVARVLSGFSCAEIETVLWLGEGYDEGATVAIKATDGERFFLEVQEV